MLNSIEEEIDQVIKSSILGIFRIHDKSLTKNQIIDKILEQEDMLLESVSNKNDPKLRNQILFYRISREKVRTLLEKIENDEWICGIRKGRYIITDIGNRIV